MGVEPTQDRSTAPQTVLKTAPATGPGVAPRSLIFARREADVTSRGWRGENERDGGGGGAAAAPPERNRGTAGF